MHIQGLGQLSITVSDLNRATRFYRDTLGLTYLFGAPNGEPHIVTKLPHHDLWMTFFRDTEDNLLALMHEAKH